MFKWFIESNRYKHFLYAMPIGMIFSWLCALGLASGMEFKDKMYGNKWDWLDWLCTVIGGIIGNLISVLVWLL
ncbi:MAG: hypothetical protein J6N78_00360 [Clostridia bacterium]|nr:hypothetical protein [Clostridia bacterium]